MQRSTFLEVNHYRFLKVFCLSVIIAVSAYVFDHHAAPGFGGTWLGYLFGTSAALIIVLLILYGIRKRYTPKFSERRRSTGVTSPGSVTVERRKHKTNWLRYRGATLRGWLSVHVYSGAALMILATLHTGFQFSWNFHTLVYFLMLGVIMSGFYGIYAYLRFPRLMTDNLEGDTFKTLLLKINDLDKLAGEKSMQFSDDICTLVIKSRQDTQIGGNFFQQLRGQRDCPTVRAVQQLGDMGKNLQDDKLKAFNDLYSVMAHKESLVTRAWNDVTHRARLQFWLYLHGPLSIALLPALIAHVVAIFYYG